jgi:hypothetical protein
MLYYVLTELIEEKQRRLRRPPRRFGSGSVTVDLTEFKPHAIDSATYHSGTINDTQHGVRTLANAHALSDLSGAITATQHGTLTSIPNAHHTPLIHDGFRAYLGSAQSINDAVWTTVNLNTVVWDDYSAFNTTTHKWTVPADGTYFCAFQVTFTDMEDGADVELCVRRSTPSPYNFVYLFYRPGGTGYMGMSGSSIDELVAGAEIYLRIYQNNTANDARTLGNSNAYTFLTVARIK